MTVNEAIEAFGVSRSTIERRTREGLLVVIRNPRDRREALLALAQLREVFGEAPASGEKASPD